MSLDGQIANLVETYCAIGKTVPHSVISLTPQAVICLGSFAHPLCNFGIVLEPDGVSLALQAGEGRSHFNIYTLGDRLDLTRHGYRCTQTLKFMRCTAPTPGLALEATTGHRDRLLVARFMCLQFFGGQRLDVRERIADANARATSLELYRFVDDATHRVIGAAMLHDTGPFVGIYNLCVDAPSRGVGWGSWVASRLVGEIGRRGKDAVLQCEPSLAGWYESFGFAETGFMQIWSPFGP